MSSSSHCANCTTLLDGPFCSTCGQQNKDIKRFFLTLINEAFEDIFKLNSRAWKTLSSLLFKPGFLTTEYLKGRRASYIQPVRLYFFTSIIFFLILSINNFLSDNPLNDLKKDDIAQVIEVETPGSISQPPNAAPPISSSEPLEPAGDINASKKLTEEEIDIKVKNDINIELPFASDAKTERLNNLVRGQVKKAIMLAQDETGAIKSMILELAPPVIFCLLPLFALLLKVGYITRGIYYTEHLVFAIHCHAFIFLTLIFYTLIPNSLSLIHTWVGGAILLWIPLYLERSLKNVYRQGKLLTILKFICLSLLYIFMLSGGILFALLLGVMTL